MPVSLCAYAIADANTVGYGTSSAPAENRPPTASRPRRIGLCSRSVVDLWLAQEDRHGPGRIADRECGWHGHRDDLWAKTPGGLQGDLEAILNHPEYKKRSAPTQGRGIA